LELFRQFRLKATRESAAFLQKKNAQKSVF